MTTRKRRAPPTPEEQAHIDDCLRTVLGGVVDRDTSEARRALAWINTPPSDADIRAAEEEWQSHPDGGVNDRERWIEARAAELHRNGLVKSFKEMLAFTRERARCDPCYALVHPVLSAAHAETKGPDPSPWHQKAARTYLEAARATDDVAGRALDDVSGLDRLARLLRERSVKAWRIVTDVVTAPELSSVLRHQATRAVESPFGLVPWADAGFAELLRSIGQTGAEAADAVLGLGAARLAQLDLPLNESDPFPWTGDRAQRDEWWNRIERAGADELLDEARLGAACWELWLHEDSHPRIYDYLAWALWEDELQPQLAAVRYPMVARPAHRQIRAALRPGLVVKEDGHQLELFRGDEWIASFEAYDDLGEFIPSLPRELWDALRASAPQVFGSVYAHRFLYRAKRQALEQQALGRMRPEDLVFPGRWLGVAQWLGMPANSDGVNDARNLVLAFTQLPVRFKLNGGAEGWTSNLVTCTDFDRGNGKGELIITGQGPMRADFEQRLIGADRNAVPLLEPPPPIGGHRGMAHQNALLVEFVGVLDERRRELAEQGAVRVPLRALDGPHWVRLARRVGMPEKNLPRLLDGWQEAQVIFSPAPDLWTLGDAYAPARALLVDGGKRSKRNAARAKAGVRVRSGAVRRRK